MCHLPRIPGDRFAREKKKGQTQIFCVIELKISLLCMSFIDPLLIQCMSFIMIKRLMKTSRINHSVPWVAILDLRRQECRTPFYRCSIETLLLVSFVHDDQKLDCLICESGIAQSTVFVSDEVGSHKVV